jgi:hypothetical protein
MLFRPSREPTRYRWASLDVGTAGTFAHCKVLKPAYSGLRSESLHTIVVNNSIRGPAVAARDMEINNIEKINLTLYSIRLLAERMLIHGQKN